MIRNNKLVNYLFLFLLFVLIFVPILQSCLTVLDPDLGWHLRVGHDLLTKEIFPRFDIYSHSYPGFPWIDHEWFLEAITYLLYTNFGFTALAVIFALIILSIFGLHLYTAKKIFKINNLLLLIIFFLAANIILSYASIRMQIFSWLMFSLLLVILLSYHYLQNKKVIYFIPLLMFVWTNLHGSFPLGLLLILLVGLFPRDKKLLLMFLISSLTTIINPYGLQLWQEFFKVAGDSYAKSHIMEWTNLFAYPISILDFLYLLVICLAVYVSNKKINLGYFIFLAMMFFSAILSKRNLPVLVFFSLPFVLYFLNDYIKKNALLKSLSSPRNLTFILSIPALAYLIAMIMVFINLKGQIFDPLKNRYNSNYPSLAIEFLKNNPQTGNLLNPLDWGGYLLWKMPENFKVFFDGRMSNWQYNHKSILINDNEIFFGGDQWETELAKYQINTILIASKSDFARTGEPDWFNKLIFKKSLANPELAKNKLLDKLNSSANWQKIYEDNVASIFVKSPPR